MHYLKLLAIVLPVVVIVDLIWLGVLMKGFYDQQLGDLARRQGGALSPRWSAAVLVYLIIPGAIVLFVRPMLPPNATIWQAFGTGALFGFFFYGIYDLTNLATLEKWNLSLTVVDMAWGCVLCGIGGVALNLAENYWGN
jgi:uncharacterized membrane protein